MGVSGILARSAATRVHVLLVEIPGYAVLRMRVEAAIASRGWVQADAPADADVLLVCGDPTGPFVDPLEAVWCQLPSPRHRCTVPDAAAVGSVLDAIPAALTDVRAQRADARTRPLRVGDRSTTDSGGNRDMSHDMGEMGREGHDGGGMDMDMSGPAGIPLASADESDRDSLEMDITHLTLGPVLPAWPAGLVARCTLHGDVIGDVSLEVLPGREPAVQESRNEPEGGTAGVGPERVSTGSDPGRSGSTETCPRPSTGAVISAARLCDTAARLLVVAGWDPVALKLYRVRDDLLNSSNSAAGPAAARARLLRVTRQIERSRTLRWSLSRIPRADGDRVGGVRDRLLAWLLSATALLSGVAAAPESPGWPHTLDNVREALIGQELTTARLTVASVDPSCFAALTEAAHG